MTPDPTNSLKSDFLSERDTQIEVSGGHFRLTVDAARGGEIARLELFDGAGWNRVWGGDGQTFPQLVLQGKQGEFALARDPRARVEQFQATPDRVAFQVTAVPCTAEGRESPWQVTLGYEIYAEGAVFVDLECTCSQADFRLTGASLGLAVDRAMTRSAKYRDLVFTRRADAAVSSARIAFGINPEKSFTNELQAIIEEKQGLAGNVTCTRAGKKGRFVWSLADGKKPLPGAVRYHNRLALGLGAAATGRPRTTVIGERIYHWINYLNLESSAEWYPTPELIDKMVAHRATMLILHQHWMRQGGSNGHPHAEYVARDDRALRAMVDHTHRRGLRVGLYMRGIEPYGLATRFFEKYLRRDFDGLYVDWHGPHIVGHHERHWPADARLGDRHFSPDGSRLPVRDYFLFTRRLRETVGPRGFLIGHMGPYAAGILPNLAFDGFLPGETGSDRKAFADRDLAAFKGMQAGVTCTPWTLDSAAYRTPEAMAKMAAWGFYPHVCLGIQRTPSEPLFSLDPDDPVYAFPLVYWRMLSTIDVHRATVYNLPGQNVVAARCDEPGLGCLVYKEDGSPSHRPRYLVLLANTAKAALKPTSVELARDVLGMSGEYKVVRIDPETGRLVPRGRTSGRVALGAIPAWGIEGFVLEPSIRGRRGMLT